MKAVLSPSQPSLRRGFAWAALVLGSVLLAGPTLAQQPAAPAQPPPTSPIVGVWIDHTGRGAVEITPCGNTFCGRIVWTKDAVDSKGQPLRDNLNPDKSKRGQPICGLQIIGDVKPQRNGTWDEGWIYDPEKGERFDVELALRQSDVLQVKGYLGVKFLSETFTWRRAPADQQRCTA